MLNSVIITGRLSQSPELRMTQSGTAITRFSIACQRDFSRSGEKKQTDFFDCVSFSGTAEFIEKYFKKGSMITITGRLQTDFYEDKDGNKRKAIRIFAEKAYFGDAIKKEEKADQSETTPANDQQPADVPDDDLPF